MFAGPNGSGKSTFKSVLPPQLLGVYLNPDEIEETIRKNGFLDLARFSVEASTHEVLSFFRDSAFLGQSGFGGEAGGLRFSDNRLSFAHVEVNSYYASVAVDFVRQKLLSQGTSFTFETVMSHESKVQLLCEAQGKGYRTYLYYIATDDPLINISRVENRVAQGGHAVPIEKIEPRYYRSLDLLAEAIRHTSRAYVFDNSIESQERTWIAEITEGRQLDIRTPVVPAWFKKHVLDKFGVATD